MVEQKKIKKNTWGFPQNDVQPSSSSLVLSYIFPFFFILPHISLTFPSFPSKEHSVGMTVKGKAFGVYFFFQLAAAHFDFWGVQSISNTPRIISSLGKSHGMVFNLALSCSDTVVIFLTCHISHYFSHIPFISLQRTHFWEAFGFDRFFICFQFLGELDGSGSCSLWFLRSAGYLHYP